MSLYIKKDKLAELNYMNKKGELQMTQYPKRNGLYYDPVEDTEEYRRVIEDVEKEISEKLKDIPIGMGFCHIYWITKKELLAERGIEWETPSECNPDVLFD